VYNNGSQWTCYESTFVQHELTLRTLDHGSSTGVPGPLGGPQSYYRGSSKSFSVRNVFFFLFYINHLNPSVHILRTVANVNYKECELQAHNASRCDWGVWACRSAIFGNKLEGEKNRLSTEWKVKYWPFKWLNIWKHKLPWIQNTLMIVLSNDETIWNLWKCFGGPCFISLSTKGSLAWKRWRPLL